IEHQHTDFPDRVSALRVAPDGKSAVFLKDTGGDENDQIFRLTLDPIPPKTGISPPPKVKPLTASPKVKNTLPVFDDTGSRIAYTSNARNGKDMDLFVADFSAKMPAGPDLGGEKAAGKPLVELTGSFSVADFRGNQALVVEARSNVDQDLWVVDVKSKAKKLLTKHTGDERWESARFSRDGKVIFALTDAGREFMSVVMVDVGTMKRVALIEIDHDVTGLALPRWSGARPKAKKGDPPSELQAKTEDLLVYDLDVDGVEQLEVLRLDDKRKKVESTGGVKNDLRGVISGIDVDPAGTVAYVSLERAEQPPEIYRVDLFTLQATRETQSDHAGVDEAKLVPAQLLSYKTFDGKPISFFWYAKAAAPGKKLPVVINVHGGPEAQAQPYWSGVTQYLALAGYAVAVPNVRGSLGYGKAFSHLDDKEKREDSVRDLSELGKFLAQRPDVDPKKLVLFGGSYGGYMVLAGLTLYPEQWAAGVDIVGIANFRTFLEQTAPYRRALREAEYGSLATDGALLDKISPIHKVDKIAAPLMVIHGTRDPRVPIGEAMQIAAALKKRGLPVELMTFEDEGHGLAKLKNRLIAYPAMVKFLDTHVKSKP
ncbi:MAG: S9 family peptidase, partial [Polyangiales bacterium]